MKYKCYTVFGPDLVVLDPHENFNVLSLSADKPKENALKTVCLMLGPDFISDHITVETSDHARFKIAVSMNNEFRVETNPESEAMLFSVPDFIGFACREVASKVRGKVASIQFEQFHKHSADIITAAVFGKNADGEVNKEVKFTANNLKADKDFADKFATGIVPKPWQEEMLETNMFDDVNKLSPLEAQCSKSLDMVLEEEEQESMRQRTASNSFFGKFFHPKRQLSTPQLPPVI